MKAKQLIENKFPQTDDYGLPVGEGGMRRFPTGSPSTGAGIILGQAGYERWKRDMAARGETVPSWMTGKIYPEDPNFTVAAKNLPRSARNKPEDAAAVRGLPGALTSRFKPTRFPPKRRESIDFNKKFPRSVTVENGMITFREGNMVVNQVENKPGVFEKLAGVRADWEDWSMNSLDLFARLGRFKRPQPDPNLPGTYPYSARV